MVRVPEVLAVHPSLPVNELAELIAYAKANPGKVNFGSAGGGSITHLAGELLKSEAKIDIVHVPYKGAAPAVTDLVGGQVQMGIFDVPVLLVAHPQRQAEGARASPARSARRTLPDVPTTAEGGYPNVTSDNWYGLIMPAATPADIQKRVYAAAVAALKSPAVERAVRQGRRHRLAQHAAGIREVPRGGAGEMGPNRHRDRLQGAELAARRFLIALLLGSAILVAVVAQPLATALLVAAVLAIVLAPVQIGFSRVLGGRPKLAATLLVLAVLALVIGPLVALSAVAVNEASAGARFLLQTVRGEGIEGLITPAAGIASALRARGARCARRRRPVPGGADQRSGRTRRFRGRHGDRRDRRLRRAGGVDAARAFLSSWSAAMTCWHGSKMSRRSGARTRAS